MSYFKAGLAVFFIALLSGCINDSVKPNNDIELDKSVLVHPELPTPVSNYKLDWKVLVLKDDVYIALNYNDSLEMRKLLEDMKRYIKESNNIMCYYRKDLKEDFCKDYFKENKAK